MAARLTRNPEIGARLPPLRPVRLNAPPAGAVMREKVGQLVQERALDLSVSVIREARVQCDREAAIVCATSRSAEPAAPVDFNAGRDRDRA
jgi:hypothetical protein